MATKKKTKESVASLMNDTFGHIKDVVKFKPTNKFGGGSLQGEVTTSYKRLVEIFGEPNVDSDGYKVSTEWSLEDEKGNIVSIYDYKMTNLYNHDSQSVEEFRNQPQYDWHIGGNDIEIANKLIEYLLSVGV